MKQYTFIAMQLTFCLSLVLKVLQLPDHHPEENKDVSELQRQINVLFLGNLSQIQALSLSPTLYQIHHLEFGSQACCEYSPSIFSDHIHSFLVPSWNSSKKQKTLRMVLPFEEVQSQLNTYQTNQGCLTATIIT